MKTALRQKALAGVAVFLSVVATLAACSNDDPGESPSATDGGEVSDDATSPSSVDAGAPAADSATDGPPMADSGPGGTDGATSTPDASTTVPADSGPTSSTCTTSYQGACLTVTSLSAGLSTSFALMSDRSVYGWGSNSEEALGQFAEAQVRAARLPAVGDIVQISAYFNHTCAVNAAGSVLCWGTQTDGELGEGVNEPATGGSMAPITVAGVSGAVEVAAGQSHTCARTQPGAVWCWGDNIDGAVGQPRPNTGDYTYAVQVPGLTGVTHVVAGDAHTCALLGGGTVSCWGLNASGQLGDGTRTTRFAPTDTSLTNVVALAAGATQTCARQSSGVVTCWGDDGYGQLGDGQTTAAGQPNHVTAGAISGATSLALGFTVSSAIVGTNVYFFGSNYWSVFGIFPSPPSASSVPLVSPMLEGASAIVLGRTHACGLFGTQVKCWGSPGNDSSLGNGVTGGEVIPQTVLWN